MIIVYAVGLALAFCAAWCLGANDAANPTDCVVGSGVITLRRAVLLFAIFVAIGALLQGFMVMKTIDRGIVPRIDVLGAFTTILAVCISSEVLGLTQAVEAVEERELFDLPY